MLYKEIEKVTICEEEVDYIKPSLASMPYVTQWIINGFAPTFMSNDQMNDLTSMQIFEEAIRYVTEINNSGVSEDDKSSVWGAALITSDASIQYLFPAIEQCFPGIELSKVTDEALNELMSLFFTSYFELLS